MKLKSLFGSLVLLATVAMSNQGLTAHDSFGGEFANFDSTGSCGFSNGCGENYGCCETGNWDCCDGTPYDAGRWSVSVNGGVTPTWFQRRGRTEHFAHAGTFLDLPVGTKVPRFNKIFDIPWNVGCELGYMVCDRVEAFADFDYTSASGRRHNHGLGSGSDSDSGVVFSRHRFTHYRAYDFYIGTRYYLSQWFCSFTPFFGAKVGLIVRDKIRTRTGRDFGSGSGSGSGGSSNGNFTRYKDDTTISGGLQFGVNWDVTACASITVKAEAVWSGDWRPEHADEASVTGALPGAPLVYFGKTGPILTVPVTVGLRYAF